MNLLTMCGNAARKRAIVAILLLLATPAALAQTQGTVNLVGPSTNPGAPQITPATINAAVNAALAAKADASNGVLTNPTIVGTCTGCGGGASLPASAPLVGANSSGAGITITPANGLTISGTNLVPTFGTTSNTFTQGNDSRLSTFTSGSAGLVPSSGGGTINFLRADGTFATPSGGGNVSNSGTPTSGQVAVWTSSTVVQGVAPTGSGAPVLGTSPTLASPTLTGTTTAAAVSSTGGLADTSTAGITTTGPAVIGGNQPPASNKNGTFIDNEVTYNAVGFTQRERYFFDTVTNTGAAVSGGADEGFFLGRQFGGTSAYPNEVNGYHSLMEDVAGSSFSAANNENFEASTLWNGAHSNAQNYLALQHIGSTGTVTTLLTGVLASLTNDNSTAASTAEYDAFLYTGISGSASTTLPTNYYAFRNKDIAAKSVFYGPTTVGQLGPCSSNFIMCVTGPDAVQGTRALHVTNSANLQMLSVADNGNVYMGGADLFLGTANATSGGIVLQDASSAFTMTLTKPSGALAANQVLRFPAVTSNDTLAVVGTAQTFTALQTINSGAGITFGATATLGLPQSTTGAGTQTFTNSPCTGLTTEQWVSVTIAGQTGTWFVPACK
jgi:hypothetical protein